MLDDRLFEVIGVMPKTFYSVNVFPTQPELWVPLSLDAFREERAIRRFLAFAQLRDGVSHTQAATAMTSVAAALEREYPQANESWGVTVVPLRQQLLGDVRQPLTLIGVAVGALFLIACFNYLSLLLASGAGRRKEMAARLALGASPRRLFRLLFVEASLLGLAGAGLGLLVAYVGIPWVTALIPTSAGVPFLDEVAVNRWVWGGALVASVMVALLTAVVTTHQGVSIGIAEATRHAATVAPADRLGRRAREGLLLVQVALSVALLLTGGLAVDTLRRLTSFPLGFDPASTVVVTSSLRGAAYQTPEARTRFFREVARRLSELPGVATVGAATAIPPGSALGAVPFTPPGAALDASGTLVGVEPNYFAALRMELVRGRAITIDDTAQSDPVVVISESLARQHFGNEDPVGRALFVRQRTPVQRRIVGVVGDVRSVGPDPSPLPTLYIPHTQFALADLTFVVRPEAGRALSPGLVRRTVASVDRMMPAYDLRTMDAVVAETDWQPRVVAVLLALFTGIGLVLVGAGLYGLLSFAVAERRREIALRLALGGSAWRVAGLIAGSVVRLVAGGALFGVVAFLVLRSIIESLLFGARSGEWGLIAAAFFVICATTLLACAVPLLGALRVSPASALKTE